jgi:hypothetical protein
LSDASGLILDSLNQRDAGAIYPGTPLKLPEGSESKILLAKKMPARPGFYIFKARKSML